MRTRKFSAVLQATPVLLRDEVRFNLDVLDRIQELLQRKFAGEVEPLAAAMGLPVAEAARLFSGYQVYPIPTLLALGRAFGEPVIGIV